MVPAPLPTAAEDLENTTFSAMLWATSRPGIVRALPQPGETAVIAAIIDRECKVYSADPELAPALYRVGAEISAIEHAQYVFLATLLSTDVLRSIAVGTDLYPDKGALVLIRGRIGHGPTARLTGPGIDGDVTLNVDGLPPGFWQHRNDIMRYPRGFDLIVIDNDQIVGVPRSTKVEIV